MANPTNTNNFVGIAGMGWLLFDKRPTNDVALWRGPITLGDGTEAHVEAKATLGKGYECKILELKSWRNLGTFKFPTFGDSKIAKTVKIKGIGEAKIWPAMTRPHPDTGLRRNCIRIQLLNSQPDQKPF